MVFLRRVALALLLLAAGCSKKPPAVTDRSVWWAPLAAWNNYGLSPAILDLLQTRGIDVHFMSGRGVRIRVPWERHAEAAELLRNSSGATQLKIYDLLAGPRPGAFLPKLGQEADQVHWKRVADFKLADLAVEKLQSALNAENIECGVIRAARSSERGDLYVPETSASSVRRMLGKGALVDVHPIEP